jgi:MFS family permease
MPTKRVCRPQFFFPFDFSGIIVFVKTPTSRIISFHYGWVIVSVGTLCIFACFGLGRFVLGMLLPSMGSSLSLGYKDMGFISTGNFTGYLIGVLISGFWTQKTGARKMIFRALLLVGLTMILSGTARGFTALLIIFTLTGFGSGATNIPVMALIASWFTREMRGRAAGFVVIGSGFAIMLSGRMVPLINKYYGSEGWRVGWYILGTTVIIIAFAARKFLRDKPSDSGLAPVGSNINLPTRPDIHDCHIRKAGYKKNMLLHLGIIYFLFGYSYVIYATFIVTTLVRERSFPESFAGELWSILGFLSLFSGPVFGYLSDKMSRKAGFIIVFSMQTISYLLIAAGLSGAFLYTSVGLYGIVAWSIPSIMAAAVGDYAETENMAKSFALVTFIFGIGQIAGPSVAGLIAETNGSFELSFLMAAACSTLAIIFSLLLRKPVCEIGS